MTKLLRILALMVFIGILPVSVIAERSLQEIKVLAEQGDTDAQVSLGDMYHKGSVVDKNNQEAEVWLLKAYEQGNIQAKRLLQEIQAERRNYVPAKDCLFWFDGCNRCDREFGCTKMACSWLREPKCLTPSK